MPLVLAGATSGSTTIQSTDAVTTTLTLPATTGTVITTGSTGQVINKASLPTGSVLQVVNATYSTQVSSATNTPVDTGLTATITPLFSTSKILVLVNQSGLYKSAANTANAIDIILRRGATTICSFISNAGVTGTLLQVNVGSGSTCFLDSPATTSATIYKTQFFSTSNTATAFVQANNDTSTITLMEIAA